ncbi:MAG TPA: 23S rRNA pseudouridine(1911/1915/1917) synthase RluD [Legionellaceae bacterium]|nr:23S rRNA pseudouridine(1911/1915/1917) synthase RluD [Legionellaceae bacterium]
MHIPHTLIGQRIDQALAQLFPTWSRSKLSTWLKKGFITINHQIYKPNDKVRGGEMIILTIPDDHHHIPHAPEARILDIIFEDDHLLVLNKPAGLIVHPGAGNPDGTLLNALLHHFAPIQNVPRAGIVHRLDKDTTGLMVVAKTLEAHTQLIRQMQARDIHRRYLALVYGHVIGGNIIETGFGRDPKQRLKMAVLPNGKPAITQYTVRKKYQFATLLHITLHTGRTHQIRVHMTYIKHPIVGDPLYQTRNSLKAGMSELLRQRLISFPRQALHAVDLQFQHPILGNELTFSAPIPYDFQSLLDDLDGAM